MLEYSQCFYHEVSIFIGRGGARPKMGIICPLVAIGVTDLTKTREGGAINLDVLGGPYTEDFFFLFMTQTMGKHFMILIL